MDQHEEARFDSQAARMWLDVLYPGNTPGLIHVSATGNWTGRAFTDRDQAVEYMAGQDQREGVYLRATTLGAQPTGGRGSAADSCALPGLWADIDIAGPGHKTEQALPPDVAAGKAVIEQSGLPAPSLWVHSGGGLYPWWLLEQPAEVTDDNLAGLEQLSARWQNLIGRSAAGLGWHYGTGVGDLARVLRVPGSVNRKAGLARPCRIIDDGDTAYTLEQLHTGLAAALERHPEPERKPSPPPAAPGGTLRHLEAVRAPGQISPNDDFEAQVAWDHELLLKDWEIVKGAPGGYCEWRRPDKDTEGISATTGFDPGRDRLKVFTDATVFTQGEVYTKPGAYAVLHHGGDHRAATRELARRSFGSPLPSPSEQQRAEIADLLPPGSPGLRVLEAVDGTSARVLDPEASQPTKRSIHLSTDADAIRQIAEAVDTRALPEVYVTNGELQELSQVSGDVSAAGLGPEDRPPLPIAANTVTADALARLLANHTYTYRTKFSKERGFYDEETVPASRTLASVLTRRYWPGMLELHGIVGSPVLRPDGTLLQKTGYDPATGLYLASKVGLPHVPDRPSIEQVAEARDFLLHHFLGDFPWVEPADRANYIGLLIAQILRPYLRTLTPFGAISASTQSSGKTILSEGIGLLYGQRVRPWVRNETEQRKAITAVLDEQAATIVFDNIREGEQIDSPVLAMLVTTPTWSDRLLGTNKTFSAPNDRLWLATGNNLRLGGDMATRTVLIRLDPKMPRPEMRTHFTIPHLDRWVKEPANRTDLLWRLLVLVMDWMAAGAPRTEHTMRQFSTWTAATGGFLAHHNIDGFLNNVEAVHELDEDDAEWATFLRRWHDIFGSEHKLARDVRQSAEVEWFGERKHDRWEGDFLSDAEGNVPTAKGLGRYLRGHIGRFHGSFVLHSRRDKIKNCVVWWVDKHDGSPA
jgi:hypothetical protein